VTALVRSELLKVRTVRSWWAYLGATVLVAGVAVAGTIGGSDSAALGTVDFQRDLFETIGIATLIGLILGITIVTSEFRHGTVTPAFLAAPARERVLGAKAAAAVLIAAGLALLALAVTVAVTVAWFAATGTELHLGSGEIWQAVGQQLLATVLWALVGFAIGSAVHGQVGALVGTLVWIFLVETLVGVLFGVLDLDELGAYLPFRALDAASGGQGGDVLSYEGGLLVSVAWIGAIAAFGVARTRRRDIT
jgi:ABC-2 type transport system permease protein